MSKKKRKSKSQQEQPYESEAYNNAWLDGHDKLVVELYEGFNKDIPKWLIEEIGGKKLVADALKSGKRQEHFDEDSSRHADRYLLDEDYRADYDCGWSDGYEELLLAIKEAFEEREIEMPKFLQKIVADEP